MKSGIGFLVVGGGGVAVLGVGTILLVVADGLGLVVGAFVVDLRVVAVAGGWAVVGFEVTGLAVVTGCFVVGFDCAVVMLTHPAGHCCVPVVISDVRVERLLVADGFVAADVGFDDCVVGFVVGRTGGSHLPCSTRMST